MASFAKIQNSNISDSTKIIIIEGNDTHTSLPVNIEPSNNYAHVLVKFSNCSTITKPTVTLELRYKMFSENSYTEPILLKTFTDVTDGVYYYRLDAELGINWLPNATMVFVFTETNGGTCEITGEYIA